MRRPCILAALLLFNVVGSAASKPRVIISTDIGGSDPDDFQSMVHYLIYADRFDTEGLISSPPKQGRADALHECIDAYEKDFPNLTSWSKDYPHPKALRALVRQGELESQPTALPKAELNPGATLIVERAKAEDPRPLWMLVWGGLSDVAQAVHGAPEIKPKLRIYSIGSWNTTNDQKARDYLFKHHPDLWWIEADETFRGIYTGGDQSGGWGNQTFPAAHVAGHGHMGAFFMKKKGEIKMGDSPSVLYLLRGEVDRPESDHWGGQFVRPDAKMRPVYWADDPDRAQVEKGKKGAKTVNKWRREYLEDWALRMDHARDSAFISYPKRTRDYLTMVNRPEKGRFRFNEEHAKNLDTWRKQGRETLKDLLGLTLMEQQHKGYVPVLKTWKTEELESHTRIFFQFQPEPGMMSALWLLKPKGAFEGKRPLVICSHGHDQWGMDTYAGVWQDEAHEKKGRASGGPVAVQAVERGYIAIVPATRGLYSESGPPDLKGRHGSRACRSHQMHALINGRTAVGERVWDVQRALDWALTLPEVDPERVVMLGNSGGGVVTVYAAGIDERIKVAVPSCSFTSFTSTTGYIFHCDCCLIPRIQPVFGDMTDVGGLIAPRALLAVHGKKDGLHHYPVVEKAMAHVKKIYTAAGASEQFEHRWGEEGHKFYPDLMWPFIEARLKED